MDFVLRAPRERTRAVPRPLFLFTLFVVILTGGNQIIVFLACYPSLPQEYQFQEDKVLVFYVHQKI